MRKTSNIIRQALLVLLVAFMAFVAPTNRADEQANPAPAYRRVKVLFLGDNGHHVPMERCRQAYSILGQHGIDITYSDHLSDLNTTNLARYDVLMLYANWDRIEPAQEKALIDYVESGHGFSVIHCGSFCFTNAPKVTEMIGGRFKSHNTGVFKETIIQPDHPIEKGLKPIESWDETYVHDMHNEKDRTVLSYRIEGDHKEPYTWVRNQGKGRVFYTAWGHDQRTWANEDFQALLERGIRWSAGDWALNEKVPVSPFTYSEAEIAIYKPGNGSLGAPKGHLQAPVDPQESIKHLVVPAGFEVKLVCSDPQVKKPICMAFDERGRLWIAETVDYPNERVDGGKGHDQITICESTKNDGVMDKFTVFADHLSIPTAMCFANGGLIVQQAPDTLFLKDTTGSGHADVRKVLFHGWGTGDTHAGPSNLHWGFDNWIYGTVGYSGFNGEINGQHVSFAMGVYRFKADGSKFEFLGSTTNNTWGMGLTEDNQIFGSTANNNPSWYLPIANRYYEQVKGMVSGRLEMICDTPNFWPITEHVRQVDCFGAYTAGAGSEVYTARSFPQWYWNRIAFVAEPTGHLLGQFEIEPKGAGYTTRNHFNLLASDDEWTAPIAGMTGPDGAVWMIDWYAFIVQHNPTPNGLRTGRGGAYETPLRDHTHGRIYRICFKDGKASQIYDLSTASPAQLVDVLKSENLLWRMHAQRLLVEKQDKSVVPALIALAADTSVDAIGLNPPAIHALWTLHGLGVLDGTSADALAVAVKDLKHPSAAVRKTAIEVLPASDGSVAAIVDAGVLSDKDAQVHKAALLAMADQPQVEKAGQAVFASLNASDEKDHWLSDAAAIAACRQDTGFLRALFAAHPGTAASGQEVKIPVTPPNLFANPSFEDLDSSGMPKSWTVRTYAGEATHSIDSPGHTGEHCLKIESTTGSDTSMFQDIAVEPHATYTLSAWIKTRNVKGALGALLNVHISDTKTIAVTGTSNWKHVEVNFQTGDQQSISVNCLFGGWGESKGTAWYDDIQLIRHHGSGIPGREGRVVGIVLEQYARRGPVDSVVATLSAVKNADPALAAEVVTGLAAGWPANTALKLSDADVTELRAVMQSLPAVAKDRLLSLAGKWGHRDLFTEQSEAVISALRSDIANAAIDAEKRADAAHRLVSAQDGQPTVDLLLKQITPAAPPTVQTGLLSALGESHLDAVGTSLVQLWPGMSPTSQKAALTLMLQKSAWTGALLDGIESGKINGKDLQPQQWDQLAGNPEKTIADRARKLRKFTGGSPSPDRAEIVKNLIHVADNAGDAGKGKAVFEKNCMVCHTLGDTGGKVGPELTGVGVRPKVDILMQILDPNRSVEGNYRQWILKTKTDVIAGRIYAESKTNVEIMDATGQIHHVLREDIQILKATDKGIMPEGLEAIGEKDLADVLEYLSQSKVKK